MKAELKLKLGNMQLSVTEEGKEQDIVKSLAFWSSLPGSCGACNSTDIKLEHRQPKGYDYYGLRCNACGAGVNFGQARESNKFYIKWDAKWEKFKKSDSNEPGDFNNEDVPF